MLQWIGDIIIFWCFDLSTKCI